MAKNVPIGHAWFLPLRAKILFAVFLALCAASFVLIDYSFHLEGQWVDQAFSDSLSRKLDQKITVKHVRFERLFSIYYDSIEVRSKKDKLLVKAGPGDIRLKSMKLGKKWRFEADLYLKDVSLTRDFYKKNLTSSGMFGLLIRKPIRVDDLLLHITEQGQLTNLIVSLCHSADVAISGHMKMNNLRVTENDLAVAISPSLVLQSIF